MFRLTKLLKRWQKRCFTNSLRRGWDPVRHLLKDECPLCNMTLEGHRYAWLAGYRFGADVPDRHEGRIKILHEGVKEFPWPSMNGHDSLYYYLLVCPVKNDSVMLEHVSGEDLYSEESIAPIFDVPADLRVNFAKEGVKWTMLDTKEKRGGSSRHAKPK